MAKLATAGLARYAPRFLRQAAAGKAPDSAREAPVLMPA